MLDNPYEFFDRVSVSGQQFLGVTDATMTHGEAWHFCQLGRMLERADKTSRILDVKYFILLPKVDRRRHAVRRHSVVGAAAIGQRAGNVPPAARPDLAGERRRSSWCSTASFPRAVLHCLTRANESLHAISGTPPGSFTNSAEQRLGQLRAELAYTQAEEVISGGLHEFVDDFQTRLNSVGEAIYESFFAMRTAGDAGHQRQVRVQPSDRLVA